MLVALALLSAIVLVGPSDQASAYCLGSTTATFNSVSPRASERNNPLSPCDGKNDYFGQVRETNTTDSFNAFVQVNGTKNGSMIGWANKGAATWRSYEFEDTNSSATWYSCSEANPTFVCSGPYSNSGF